MSTVTLGDGDEERKLTTHLCSVNFLFASEFNSIYHPSCCFVLQNNKN